MKHNALCAVSAGTSRDMMYCEKKLVKIKPRRMSDFCGQERMSMHRWMIEKKCGISVRIPLKGFRLSYCVNRSIVVITEIQKQNQCYFGCRCKTYEKNHKIAYNLYMVKFKTNTYQLLLLSLFDFITLHPPPLAASGS